MQPAVLARGLAEVVRRHEVLRTSYAAVDGEPVQLIHPPDMAAGAATAGSEAAADSATAAGGARLLRQVDLAALPEAVREATARRLTVQEARRPFDLERAPVLRATLLRLAAEEHVLLLTVHHIACDGWSVGVLVQEAGLLYEAFADASPPPRPAGSAGNGGFAGLPDLAVQYADFAAWQRRWLAGEMLQAQLGYWRKQLAGLPPAIELPVDRPRPVRRRALGGRVDLRLSAALGTALRALARRQLATPFMVLLSAFQALLARYSGQEDLAVGTPVAGRRRVEVEGLIGCFANTLVLRGDLRRQPSLVQLLARSREAGLAAYSHQDLPFEGLVEGMQLRRDLARSPLFQVMMVLQNAATQVPRLPGLTATRWASDSGTAKFDLTLTLTEDERGLPGFASSFEYDAELFHRPTVVRLAGHFDSLLAAALAAPEVPLAELGLLSDAEYQQLAEWSSSPAETAAGAVVPAGSGPSLAELFQDQARRTPDAAAVVCGDEVLTYGGLLRRSERVARRLRALGVAPGVRVGLCSECVPDLIAGLYGIVMAGGSYVPLDPAYPEQRWAWMLADSGAPVVVTQGRLRERVAAAAARAKDEGAAAEPKVVCVDRLEGEGAAAGPGFGRDAGPGAWGAGADDLIYVIYTSGSTGRAKGAGVYQRSFQKLVRWYMTEFKVTDADRFLLITSYGFDQAQKNLFASLLAGGQLHLAARDVYDPALLTATIARQGITRLNCTPSAFVPLATGPDPAALAALRSVFLGGEPIPVALLDPWRRSPGCRAEVVNTYGPTECTDTVTWHRLPAPRGAGQAGDAAPPPIGRPLPEVAVWIADRQPALVPIGVPGQLCLGGDFVGAGYLGNAVQTAAAFVPDPWSGGTGARLYLTGDLARFLPDGEIEFLGRVDQQVKIRGFRVEIGEVESVLARLPQVREAAVVPRPSGAGSALQLVAYVVVADRSDRELVPELRRAARAALPDYMVPGAFVALDALPLTAHGKLDRDALPPPEPGSQARHETYAAPRTAFEEGLAQIWADLLGVDRIGTGDDFFDLGGNSLLATQVVSRLRQRFGVEMPVRALFEEPTVAGLAGQVEAALQAAAAAGAGAAAPVRIAAAPPVAVGAAAGAAAAGAPPAAAAAAAGLPLSFAQQRLWFLDRLSPGSAAYNMPLAVRLTGDLDAAALTAAVAVVVARHQTLRTTFHEVAGEPRQRIAPPPAAGAAGLALARVDLRRLPQPLAAAMDLAAAEVRRPFDLARGPLFRPLLLCVAERDHVWLGTMHHIVADGWSVGILIREVSVVYAALTAGRAPRLPALPVQYADYAAWQRQWLTGEVLTAELDHWRERLAGLPQHLELPTDRPHPPAEAMAGDTRPCRLSPAAATQLRERARASGVTSFMWLLAAFQALLGRVTGQRDLAVGTPIAGRNRLEIEGLIGCFVNTLVLRADLARDPGFGELLARTREATLAAYAHQDVPFERLVEELAPARDFARHPLFQAMFALQRSPARELRLPGLAFALVPLTSRTAKFELALSLSEAADGIGGGLEYKTELFDAATAERLLGHFAVLLDAVAADPALPLSKLPLLTAGERHQLLVEWNDSRPQQGEDVIALFRRAAAAAPQETALVVAGEHGEERLSYGELDAWAGEVAERLRGLGVAPGVPVALAASRGPALVAGLLGILGAGGCFVPLDPALPEARLAFLLADTAAQVVVGEEEALAALPPHQAGVLVLGRSGSPVPATTAGAAGGAGAARPEGVAPLAGRGDLAYLIYTSGTTGEPKAVAVERGNLADVLAAARGLLRFGPADRMLVAAPFSFDIFLFELLSPLTTGGTALLFPLRPALDFERLAAALPRLTVVHAVPATARQLLATLERQGRGAPAAPALRAVLVGGDAVPAELLADLARRFPRARIWELYGPTEATILAAAYPVPPSPAAPPPLAGSPGSASPPALSPAPPAPVRSLLGRPLPGARLELRDGDGNLVPVGVHGEIWVGGAGVARGYLRRPEITAEKFVTAAGEAGEAGAAGGRRYRSGDLARQLPDGSLEFLGRRDGQVKLRGFRVEIGEIEAQLRRLPEVREAVVLVRQDADGGRLEAYVVPAPGEAPGATPLAAGVLRAALAQQLPDYMVPAVFVLLDALPLTANGKVDRQALAAAGAAAGWERRERRAGTSGGAAEGAVPPTAPRDAVEAALAAIWSELLGRDDFGVDDGFFALGGHSLLAVRLVARIRERFGFKLSLSVLFRAPTIARLAVLLRAGCGASAARPALVELTPSRNGSGPPSARPFFCVHPAGGNVVCYAELARALGPEQPLYALQLPDPETLGAEPTIEELAAHYLAALAAVTPAGPYALGGWSLGGVIAYEMARQVRAAGGEVDLVALIDPSPVALSQGAAAAREAARTDPAGEARLRRQFAGDLLALAGLGNEGAAAAREAFGELDLERPFPELAATAQKVGLLPPELKPEDSERLFEAYRTTGRALDRYRPAGYPGRLTLLLAGRGLAATANRRRQADAVQDWASLAAGGAEIEALPGDHYSIVRPPAVEVLAAALRRRLAR
ncbi:MAG TPA: amino acid adenylation domain-containing protein [Thermoanaerobaculia bacterium]|nr:amino acid adenylation domain-containing protein [Thermoanaerobaculia bacterium]